MQSIWPKNKKLEIIGVSGEPNSGKTLWLCRIDPRNTLIYDLEKSSGDYADELGLTRVDLPQMLLEKYPGGHTQQQLFEAWLEHISNVEPGKYSVIAVDPIEDLEAGLCEYVKSQYRSYGFASADKFASTGGIYWAKVREKWRSIILSRSGLCQTFCFTNHLRTVWKAGQPTKEKEPRGKSALYELASLYLMLDRSAPKNGNVPEIPVAYLKKCRIVGFDESGKPRPYLPPRIPDCDPDKIRYYILNPPNYSSLSEAERVEERGLSEDERLELQASIEANRLAAKELEIAEQQRAEESRVAHRVAKEKASEAARNVSEDESSQLLKEAEDLGVLQRVRKAIETILAKREIDHAKMGPQYLTRKEYEAFWKQLKRIRAEAETQQKT